MNKKAKEVMLSLGQDVDPTKAAGTFGMGIQQMIEIAKAVLIDAKMIIMDEPTSSLGEKEVEQLMKTCRELKSRGIGIVFVSHKLEELFELCDRVTVIRDGEYIDTRPIDQWDNDSLIKAMVGRIVDNQFPKEFGTKGECFLKVEDLTAAEFWIMSALRLTAVRYWASPGLSAQEELKLCARFSELILLTAEEFSSRAKKSTYAALSRQSTQE